MNTDTRSRLLEASARLFADHGYRGASVRRICDLARANPGAVSYHFGGKKQLYRIVLRRAASQLAQTRTEPADDRKAASPLVIGAVVDRILDSMDRHHTEAQLLLRDLADGGEVAVEALEPALRAAFEDLSLAIGEEGAPRGFSTGRALFIDLAAPLFLLTGAWPVLERALDLDEGQRRGLLRAACRRTLAAHGHSELA